MSLGSSQEIDHKSGAARNLDHRYGEKAARDGSSCADPEDVRAGVGEAEPPEEGADGDVMATAREEKVHRRGSLEALVA